MARRNRVNRVWLSYTKAIDSLMSLPDNVSALEFISSIFNRKMDAIKQDLEGFKRSSIIHNINKKGLEIAKTIRKGSNDNEPELL